MRIDDRLHALGMTFAAVTIRGLTATDMAPALRDEWQRRVAAVTERCRASPIAGSPEIVALHGVYAALNIGLRHGRPSIERMGGLLAKGRDFPRINLVADLYNLHSLESKLCMGAHDLDLLELPVDLRLTTGAESFAPLGGAAEPVRPGEFSYVDAANRVICRLDAVQADFSKVASGTRNVLLVVEGSPATPPETVLDVARSTSEAISLAGGGRADEPIFATPTNFA